jgi:hypothetical protein
MWKRMIYKKIRKSKTTGVEFEIVFENVGLRLVLK